MTQRLRATEMGTKAHGLLADPYGRWTVLASVSGAIYLESDREEVLWMGRGGSARHRRAILLSNMPSRLPAPGTPCGLHGGSLSMGDELVVDLADAAVWRPDLAVRREGRGARRSGRLADAIRRAAMQSAPRGRFMRAAFPALPDADSGSGETVGATIATAIQRGIAALGRAAAGGDLSEGLERAAGLIGLGEGLTPSGDDFLGAFLFTLRMLDRTLPVPYRMDWQFIGGWLRCVKPLTNKISYAVLADHARGEAGEALSALLHATLAGSSQRELVQLAWPVAEIGHSSGWDMLSGVYCASSVLSSRAQDQRGLEFEG